MDTFQTTIAASNILGIHSDVKMIFFKTLNIKIGFSSVSGNELVLLEGLCWLFEGCP